MALAVTASVAMDRISTQSYRGMDQNGLPDQAKIP